MQYHPYHYVTPLCPLLRGVVILHLLDSNTFFTISQAVSITTVEDMKIKKVTAEHNQNHGQMDTSLHHLSECLVFK